MSKLSLQFHALPIEVINCIREDISNLNINVTLVIGYPSSFIQWDKNADTIESNPDVKSLVFTLDVPNVENAKSVYDFLKNNRDALVLEIGRITQSGLSESWLSAMTDNVEIMKKWKTIARKLSAAMKKGIIAESPVNGASALIKSHYYSSGAENAYRGGIALLPIAGNSILKVPE